MVEIGLIQDRLVCIEHVPNERLSFCRKYPVHLAASIRINGGICSQISDPRYQMISHFVPPALTTCLFTCSWIYPDPPLSISITLRTTRLFRIFFLKKARIIYAMPNCPRAVEVEYLQVFQDRSGPCLSSLDSRSWHL
jgi:hypothetical protein